ncbi:MAG: hypothetical protein CMN50_08995 [SAR116 cluster bacterium]|nr:hypothetical protein [SAR116 cluster bacterium]
MKENKKKKFLKTEINNFVIFFEFLLLGLTSFGGPVAHIAYFRDNFVLKKKWFDEKTYLDIVSFSNFLPGPSSSQVGMCIGYLKNGILGSFFAWLGFTLPSAVIMILFAFGYSYFDEYISLGFLNGIKAVVIIIVLQAIIGMSRQHLNDLKKILIATFTAITLVLFDLYSYQFFLLSVAAVIGLVLFNDQQKIKPGKIEIHYSSIIFILVFLILFISLPILSNFYDIISIEISDKFFRTGSLVFGGGHIVLPLLKNEILNFNLIDEETFIFGYGLAQAIPGPLFTFSAFLGSSLNIEIGKLASGILCLLMIFLPSFLLVLGVMPYWSFFRSLNYIRNCLIGVNACVVGLLIAAFYNPIIISSLNEKNDYILVLLGGVIIFFFKLPQWLSVLTLGIFGFILNYFF